MTITWTPTLAAAMERRVGIPGGWSTASDALGLRAA